MACTLNAARVLTATARMLGVDLDRFSELALSAPSGAEGVVVVPYLEGERTPNLPDATGAVHGLTLTNATPANMARAAVEGMLCGLAAGLDALAGHGVRITGLQLIGGAAAMPAVHAIAPTIFGVPVRIPAPGEYVADGAARQAAWALTGGESPPRWPSHTRPGPSAEGPAMPAVRQRYADAALLYLPR